MFSSKETLGYHRALIEQAAKVIRGRSNIEPLVALVLGSGLGSFAEVLGNKIEIPYTELPGFPESTVSGHSGKLVLGDVGGVPLVVQQGRFHVYEGYSASQVVFPLRVMAALGAGSLVITNAAGGARPEFMPGDFMIIDDLINFQFRSALRGRGSLVDDDRFVDLKDVFSPRLKNLAAASALDLGLSGVHTGVYWGNLGPIYETRAEVAMIRRLGGDAVGMSTVPEAIVAAHCKMETLGISCISNPAAGLSALPLRHEDVLETTRRIESKFKVWLQDLLPKL
jgi:purine-nucleoside phosphorylase